MGRLNTERNARRLLDGVDTFRGPLLPGRRNGPGVPVALEGWAGFTLIVVAHAIEERYAGAMRILGISLRDFAVLAEVARVPGVTQSALAERVGLGRSRMSEQLLVLDSAGYVERRIGVRDLRQRRIFPTFGGQEVVEEATERLTEIDSGWLSLLAPKERHAFTAALRRFR